jgi:hypothetical protein
MDTPKLTGNRCQCPTCGEYFTSARAFDRHRTGSYAKPGQPYTRRCMTVAEMDAAGFERNARGFRGEPARIATHSEIPAPRAPMAMVTPRGTPAAPETCVSVGAP